MKRIIVTGGAGFIGSHLVDQLLAEDAWQVTVIDNFNDFYSPDIKYQNIKRHLPDVRFKLVEADIVDAPKMNLVFRSVRPQYVVHLAARAGVRPSLSDPLGYQETNIRGTLNLLEAARNFQIKHFIFGSSSSVYGSSEKVPFNEDDPVNRPISPYAMTKAAGELICYTYAHLYRLRCVCLRFFTVYGARQRPDLAIHKFAELIANGEPIPVFGQGETRRDYTYIDDIIAGLRAAIDYEETLYEVINLGESETVELNRLIGLIEHEIGRPAIIDRQPPQPGDVPQTFADITKARRLLGYDPQTGIEDGIRKFVGWFMAKSDSNLIGFESFKNTRSKINATAMKFRQGR